MTGSQHYTQAEEALQMVARSGELKVTDSLIYAQVHATLALAAYAEHLGTIADALATHAKGGMP